MSEDRNLKTEGRRSDMQGHPQFDLDLKFAWILALRFEI